MNSPDIQTSSSADTNSATFNDYENLKEEIKNYRKDAEKIKLDFSKLEADTHRINFFTTSVTIAILVVVSLGGLAIFSDYLFFSNQRHKYYLEEINKLNANFYTKEEVDEKIRLFKSCIFAGSWSGCFAQ